MSRCPLKHVCAQKGGVFIGLIYRAFINSQWTVAADGQTMPRGNPANGKTVAQKLEYFAGVARAMTGARPSWSVREAEARQVALVTGNTWVVKPLSIAPRTNPGMTF